MADTQRIIPINLEEEMKSAYIDYSMSVIVSRALPDVRDGLKPVHRRVLYGMSELGLSYTRPHKKSARIVGEVLGKYHPHGDSSVYDAMVRMAQEWSLRYPLVDGQGNFGSMDGDSPAAMRYTEARLRRIADELLADIDKDTVDFVNNFDDSLKEPSVLPSRIPNLLVNGASGIAVGMATNMLPHNLAEVVDGIVHTIDHPEATIEDLTQFIKAPDFPTGGIIYGYEGVKEGFETGRGRVVVRGRARIEEKSSGREVIIISEIPYQVNKASLVMKIADLVNEKRIEGITDIRDESDRNGLRIVVDVRRDAMASVILSKLYKYTPLQTSYGINNIALVKGRPMLLNLKDMIEEFIEFRLEVITRRTQYELDKARKRAHILEGLLIALDHLDEVIKLIRASATPDEAREGLMSKFGLSEVQAKAILDMRLQRLTGLERDKIKDEYDELQKKIAYYEAVLEQEDLRRGIAKDELLEVKERYGDERKTEINYAAGNIRIEDLIPEQDVVITISHLGYIKRTNVMEYRSQGRGGIGSRSTKNRNEDFVEHLFVANTHHYLLLFTEQGRCYWLRVFEVPEASKASAGRAIQNILSIPKDDKVRAYIRVPDLTDEEFIDNNFIVFATKQGMVKKTLVKAYSRPRVTGINAITINEGDELIEAKLLTKGEDIMLATRSGASIRFPQSDVRSMGRGAAGVRGIRLSESFGGDAVIGMAAVDRENDTDTTILVLSENGLGKRTYRAEYRLQGRGGKGIKTIQRTKRTGPLVALRAVTDDQDLMIIKKSGVTIRVSVEELPILGRSTQGVRVVNVSDKETIADVAIVESMDEEEILAEAEASEIEGIPPGGDLTDDMMDAMDEEE